MEPFRLKLTIVRDASFVRETRKTYRDMLKRSDALKKSAKKLAKTDPDAIAKVRSMESKAANMRSQAGDLRYEVKDRLGRRFNHLAYGFLKGRTYRECEPVTHNPISTYQIDTIAKIANIDKALIGFWIEEGDKVRKDMEGGLMIHAKIKEAKVTVQTLLYARDKADRDWLSAKNNVGYEEQRVRSAIRHADACLVEQKKAGISFDAGQKAVRDLEQELNDYVASKHQPVKEAA